MTGTQEKTLPKTILFACGQNIVRSPIAAALMRHLYGSHVIVESVGLTCGMPDGFVVAVMGEMGIDLNEHEAKSFDDLQGSKFEEIVVLAPEVLEEANRASLDKSHKPVFWPIPDPTLATGNREQKLEAYRAVRDLLLKKIKERFGEVL